jgi:hypothetical protein
VTAKRLECATHGSVPWSSQVVCARDVGGCGAVWWLNGGHHPPPELKKKCTCGKPLVGVGGTARAICANCYNDKAPREARA